MAAPVVGRRAAGTLVAVIAAVIAFGCGDEEEAGHSSPRQVVSTYLKASDQGDAKLVCEQFVPALRETIAVEAGQGSCEDVYGGPLELQRETRGDRGARRYIYEVDKHTSDQATVSVAYPALRGTQEFELARVDGKWFITIGESDETEESIQLVAGGGPRQVLQRYLTAMQLFDGDEACWELLPRVVQEIGGHRRCADVLLYLRDAIKKAGPKVRVYFRIGRVMVAGSRARAAVRYPGIRTPLDYVLIERGPAWYVASDPNISTAKAISRKRSET